MKWIVWTVTMAIVLASVAPAGAWELWNHGWARAGVDMTPSSQQERGSYTMDDFIMSVVGLSCLALATVATVDYLQGNTNPDDGTLALAIIAFYAGTSMLGLYN